MPRRPPTPPAPRPTLRSQVVINPLGLWAGGMFGLGVLLLLIAALKAAAGNEQRAVTAGLLGLVLLLLTWRRVARRNCPMLLTSSADALHLEPANHRRAHGLRAETIPLASIVAYAHWLRVLRFRAFAQYHLRLELADGRVLHLADQPRSAADDPTGTVRLDAVARRLARRGKAGPRRRQSFYLTQTARALLWGSWGAVAAGLALVGLGQDMGLFLVVPGATYWALYSLGRGSAEITA
ncbi:hypothetical protein MUN82_04945 [Hymenobacter aerilatus]|uniref:PH domain-containing protein n=1 Tax=Hymenobacter aerilatus TaxID=2932251 RepID=A0A8T9T0D4_9BACT|nr:hypothetical protein [Hymenobacter aerilatus]UOR06443.1 hypothetical protein MUN82_04945 [Hymenobacter aerilatus]